MIRLRNCVLALALAATLSASGQEHVLDVRTNKAGAEVAKTMYGLFFEDDKKQSRLADTLPPMSMRVYRIASQK